MRAEVRYAGYLAEGHGWVDRVYPDQAMERPPFPPWRRFCAVEPEPPVSIPLAGRPACGQVPQRLPRVELARDAEGPAEQWALLRRRLNRQPRREDRAPVRKLIRAYEEATGTGVYCD
jgi:hypothetical protein